MPYLHTIKFKQNIFYDMSSYDEILEMGFR